MFGEERKKKNTKMRERPVTEPSHKHTKQAYERAGVEEEIETESSNLTVKVKWCGQSNSDAEKKGQRKLMTYGWDNCRPEHWAAAKWGPKDRQETKKGGYKNGIRTERRVSTGF